MTDGASLREGQILTGPMATCRSRFELRSGMMTRRSTSQCVEEYPQRRSPGATCPQASAPASFPEITASRLSTCPSEQFVAFLKELRLRVVSVTARQDDLGSGNLLQAVAEHRTVDFFEDVATDLD